MMVPLLLILRARRSSFATIFIAKYGNRCGFCILRVQRSACRLFGAALANVVRGVPLDASGYFFEPLWTNFQVGEQTGILDWYRFLSECCHCCAGDARQLVVQMKTSGAVSERARSWAGGVGGEC